MHIPGLGWEQCQCGDATVFC